MLRSILFTAAFLLVVGVSNSYAKIWRVNNNPGVAADFTTLSAAHTGAASGDTIHVEGSPNQYGNITLTKKLVIIGPGYYLDENPNTQAFTQSAKVQTVTFNVGSSGSEVMGLDFQGNSCNVYCNDIVIRRNKFSSINGSTTDYYTGAINLYYLSSNSNIPVSNIIISQNYGVTIDINYASTGILITSNFIAAPGHSGDGSTTSCLNVNANAIALIQNNIFRRGKVTAYNSNLTNNIMVFGSFVGTGNLVSNNLANGTQFGNANSNQENVTMSTVFVGAGTGVSTDGQWRLKAGSPAIGAGYGSTAQNPVDAGMYSGQTPYVVAGQPSIPAIYFFENQPVGSNTDPIDVTIKVKSAGN